MGALLPVGSSRRAGAVRLARNAGVLPAVKPSEYQRWIATVEPWLFSSATDEERAAVSGVPFHIEVRLGSATVADVERTFLSLGNQTHQRWTASVLGVNPSVDPNISATLARLRDGERRIDAILSGDPESWCVIVVDAGDMFASQALLKRPAW